MSLAAGATDVDVEGSVTDRVLEDMQDSATHELRWSAYTRPSTGLVYMQARYYDPETGRFTQHDPVPYGMEVLWGQNNRWAYCASDPVNASDPSGEFMWMLLGAVLLGVGAGLQVAAWFTDDPNTARTLAVAGIVIGFVGALMMGGPLLAQQARAAIRAVVAGVLVLMLRFMAMLVGGYLGVNAATRFAGTRINTISEFLCWLKRAAGR